ncbi:efflux RND transporter periplasmic adaptor subunit [Rhizobium sp. SL86]|uniref:efflux RND transporter periplasmic adaptor subunit n=1 Tax=Rhizobium sp. SL86 TaxID=2995148 RepID=UPI0022747063|nr:efflux RND transporter periplasmic adaptor subunit [Rhizobium sp. SL86]MCY1667731.1 efflux RND transporter periplasmic adaptor subunit [Rhizobium sp. SL86]
MLPSAYATAAGDAIDELPVRGVIRSLNHATLSTNIGAKVSTISFRVGEHFRTGDPLVTFDCRAEKARLSAAEAVSKERSVNVKTTKYLQGLKAGSTQEVEIAEVKLEQAQAEVEAMAATLEDCVLTAPFDGVVEELHVRENERPSDNSPIITIVDVRSSEIELIVTSNWIKDMVPGRRFTFRIDETGESRIAIISRTAPVVDPSSQTLRVFARFAEDADSVLPGMSGEATFNVDWELR